MYLGASNNNVYYNVTYQPSGDLYQEHDTVYNESTSKYNTFQSIDNTSTSSYIYPVHDFFRQGIGGDDESVVKYISYNFKPVNMPTLNSGEVFIPVSYHADIRYRTESYADFKLLPFDGSSDNSVCDNFHHRSHGLQYVGGYYQPDNSTAHVSGVFKNSSKRVFWDEDNLGVAVSVNNWAQTAIEKAIGDNVNGTTYGSSPDTINLISEYYKIYNISMTVSGYVQDRDAVTNMSVYGGNAVMKTLKCKITDRVDPNQTWDEISRYNRQTEIWSPLKSQTNTDSYFNHSFFDWNGYRWDGTNHIWESSDSSKSGIFTKRNPALLYNTSGVQSFDPYISTANTYFSGSIHSFTVDDDFSIFFRNNWAEGSNNPELLSMTTSNGNVIVRSELGNIKAYASSAYGNPASTTVESKPSTSRRETKNLIVNNSSNNTMEIYTYDSDGNESSGILYNVSDYVGAGASLDIMNVLSFDTLNVHEVGIHSGNISLKTFNDFVRDKYYGSGVFDKALNTSNPSGDTSFLSLNISGFRGEFSRSDEYYESDVYEDGPLGVYSILEMNCPSFRREIQIPEHEELFLYNIHDWDKDSEKSPKLKIWCHNNSDNTLGTFVLRSKMILDGVEFHSDDVLISRTTQPQLITTQFRPRVEPTGTLPFSVIDSATSGAIHFSIESPRSDDGINLDFKIYSSEIEITGYDSWTTLSGLNELYLKGRGESNINNTLYTYGDNNPSNDLDLFLSTAEPSNTPTFPLFLENNTFDSSGDISLYSQSLESLNKEDNTLFTRSFNEANAGVNLFLPNSGIPNDSMNLLLYNEDIYSSGNNLADLYIASLNRTQDWSGAPHVNMFLGQGYVSGDVPLYLRSSTSNGIGTPSFNNSTLFISNTKSNHSIHMFLNSDSVSESGNVPLNIYASSSSGNSLYKAKTLYISSDSTQSMNLFLKNSSSLTNENNDYIPLYMNGYMSRGSLEMFVKNEYTQTSINNDLWMKGRSPDMSGIMNLFINRDFDGIIHKIPMALWGTQSGIQSIDLYISGVPTHNDLVNMFISGQGEPNNTTELYTHGF